MIITVAIFYYAFFVVVAVFALYSFFNLYHLFRFGFLTVTNVTAIALYFFLALTYLAFAFQLLGVIDWSTELFVISDSGNNDFDL